MSETQLVLGPKICRPCNTPEPQVPLHCLPNGQLGSCSRRTHQAAVVIMGKFK